jgi:hypothetical protein
MIGLSGNEKDASEVQFENHPETAGQSAETGGGRRPFRWMG